MQRERDVHLLEVALLDVRAAAEAAPAPAPALAGPLKLAKALLDLGDDRLVIDRAGRGDHHVRARGSCAPR